MNLDSSNLTFGIPNTKELKQVSKEKYPTEPVLTLVGKDFSKQRVSNVCSFNSEARKALNLDKNGNRDFVVMYHDSAIIIGRMEDWTEAQGTKGMWTVTKSYTVTKQSLYNFIQSTLGNVVEKFNQYEIEATEEGSDATVGTYTHQNLEGSDKDFLLTPVTVTKDEVEITVYTLNIIETPELSTIVTLKSLEEGIEVEATTDELPEVTSEAVKVNEELVITEEDTNNWD